MTIATEQCANCGRIIGAIEMPYVWSAHVVCGQCYQALLFSTPIAVPLEKLSISDLAEPVDQIAHYALRKKSFSAPPLLGPNSIICPNPNCGYRGEGQKQAKGSLLVSIFLLLLSVIPGLLYDIFCRGNMLVCPICGAKVRDL